MAVAGSTSQLWILIFGVLAGPSQDPCSQILARALEAVSAGRVADAEAHFERGLELCPDDRALLRESAAFRFRQNRHHEAQEIIGRYLELSPESEWGWELLGSSRYLDGDPVGALSAWNRIGRPTVGEVEVTGADSARSARSANAAEVELGTLLTPDVLLTARRRLEDLPSVRQASVDYRPLGGGEARLVVRVQPVKANPFGRLDWPTHALRLTRLEVDLRSANPLGRLEEGRLRLQREGSLRRLQMHVSAPSPGNTGVGWVQGVVDRGRWAKGAEDEATLIRRRGIFLQLAFRPLPTLQVGGQAGVLARSPDSGGGVVGAFALFEQRPRDGTVPLRLLLEGTLNGAGGTEGRIRGAASWHQPLPRGLDLEVHAGAEGVTAGLPPDLLPRFGADRTANRRMRARTATDADGVIRPVFPGRGWVTGSAELRRWGTGTASQFLGVALFVDGVQVVLSPRTSSSAESSAPAEAASSALRSGLDAGVGLRIREPAGTGVLRLDWGFNAGGSGSRLSLSWMRPLGPGFAY